MKNSDLWRPSKFVYTDGKLRASRNEHEVTFSSRFVADLVAHQYDQHLRYHVRGRLIDLGCGKVPFYESYKNFTTEVICVDWESSIHNNPFLDISCDLNNSLPFNDGEFDTIIISDVLEHISRPGALWQEMNRILSPGGKVILNVPFFYKLHETPHDYFRYTKYTLMNFADSCGFKIDLLQEIGGLPEILTDLSGKFIAHTPLVGKTLSNLIQFTGRFFIQTTFGKRLSEKTCENYPLGYFMIVTKLS